MLTDAAWLADVQSKKPDKVKNNNSTRKLIVCPDSMTKIIPKVDEEGGMSYQPKHRCCLYIKEQQI